ncbi:hypothetical protein [Priestia megaterium]|uniref:hypothetical protein n=1 Tax=Priestia megaterium TaxID=1404 RepID=UPI001C21484C|nr:hypothetical protein [Priestia megaterium]MBU8689507.1 hypothetical protein [Priestia megaterium]
MERQKFIECLDKLIDRSDRWAKDAEKREDWNIAMYYEGQTKAFEEVKRMIKREIDQHLQV